jgi:putative heme-binding domain-containing protein
MRWLFVFALSVLATALIGTYSAQQSPTPDKLAQKKEPAVRPRGQQSFETHCASCHGLDGKGGEHAPAIATPRAAGDMDDAAIFQIIRGGIPAKGMLSFSSLSEPEVHAIIAYLRVLTGKTTVRPAKGNAARGEQVFFAKAQCGDCHMMLGKGGFLGSDLTDFAGTHSIDEIRRAILNPDQWIAPEQNAVTVTTLSQERVTGLVRNENNFSLQVQDTDGVFHLFEKSQIAKVDRSAHSLMPTDYGTRLTPAEMDDLINFLFSGLPAPAHAPGGAVRAAQKVAPKPPIKPPSK